MNINSAISDAFEQKKLFESSYKNLSLWLEKNFLPEWAKDSITELVSEEAWKELNDRFYKTLEFGTGGMRGRTIGNIVTQAEQGTPSSRGAPEHSCVGTAAFNDFNVVRATLGLFRYCQDALMEMDVPKLVIAYDSRHFSKHFCHLAASVWTQCGGAAFIFDGPRSTPQLSYTVRLIKATAGIVISASHNPSHDNGYKVYFSNGGQVVPPHADGIIYYVDKVGLTEIPPYLTKNIEQVITLSTEIEGNYQEVLYETILDPEMLETYRPKVVFSPIHGTGHIASWPAMRHFRVNIDAVKSQMVMDGRFPTVKSPNPENAEALEMSIELAKKINADVVLATDPDGDRMGAAVRNKEGEYVLLSGNNIGSLLAAYRLTKLKEVGVLRDGLNSSTALIKTFVTTPMQEAIAKSFGLKVINTMTGFKWIGEKLADYESELQENLLKNEGFVIDYDQTPWVSRIQLLQKYSTFYAFGGEESYGYLSTDSVRDKDANAATIQFCEVVAYAKKHNLTIPEYLDQLFLKYGYFYEKLLNLYYEGATGALRIKNIIKSYRTDPPKKIGPFKVEKLTDFRKETMKDADGKVIPSQDFFLVALDNGYSYAVRASGTEPKIKFYLFAQEPVDSMKALEIVKIKAQKTIQDLYNALEADAEDRSNRARVNEI